MHASERKRLAMRVALLLGTTFFLAILVIFSFPSVYYLMKEKTHLTQFDSLFFFVSTKTVYQSILYLFMKLLVV